MIDHNFTDAETVKALECCNTPGSCFECPYYGTNEVEYDDICVQKLIIDILPIINRQKSEIERLQAVHADMTESLRLAAEANKDMSVELDAMRGAANSYKMHYEEAQAEIERLNKEVDRLSQCVLYHDGIVSDLERDLFNAKAEAIKEFAQRLKKRARMPLGTLYGGMVYLKDIDNLVKIMTEDNNESQNT